MKFALSETPKTSFLSTRPICCSVIAECPSLNFLTLIDLKLQKMGRTQSLYAASLVFPGVEIIIRRRYP